MTVYPRNRLPPANDGTGRNPVPNTLFGNS